MDADGIIKRLLIKDLRIQCRQRKISPAGSKEDLGERLKEHMIASNDFSLYNEDGSVLGEGQTVQLFGTSSNGYGNNFSRPDGQNVGNFLGARPSSRVLAAPGGASQVSFGNEPPAGTVPPPREAAPESPAPEQPQSEPPVATPGDKKASFLSAMTAKIAGNSGAPSSTPTAYSKVAPTAPPEPVSQSPTLENNPASPNAQPGVGTSNNNYGRPAGQNVGNFLTDKPSSRVLAPPGGASSFRLG